MTTAHWLALATKTLQAAGIATARLDSLVLLKDCLKTSKADLLAHPERLISVDNENVLNNQLQQRAQHVPLAYIRGRTDFYGREFIISPAVLQPRPESETMIDLFKELMGELTEDYKPAHLAGKNRQQSRFNAAAQKEQVLASGLATYKSRLTSLISTAPPLFRVADVGCGCGAIGITARLEVPQVAVDLLEIDEGALKIAKVNVAKHTTVTPIIKTDLLIGSSQAYDILLCNLPYVPDNYQINTAALHEPRLAIFGGPDGLDIYRQLFNQIKNIEYKPLYVLIENLPPQHATSKLIAEAAGYHLIDSQDFIQVFQA